MRDLAWLLNTVNYHSAHPLDGHPLVARSVLNYGLPELTGRVVASMTAKELEALVKQAILDFEPRILPDTVRVRAILSQDQMNRNAVGFEIEGDLWAHPMPLRLLIKTEIDIETGHVSIPGTSLGRRRRLMDPRFLEYYDRELRHLAESCGEFAADFPKIAGRLGLEGFIKEFQCPDPYVERLLEGFAYMAARVQLKVDAEYPQFTQHLLEMVYPDYLAPTPSLGIVRFQPDMSQGSLADGIAVPRGTPAEKRPRSRRADPLPVSDRARA